MPSGRYAVLGDDGEPVGTESFRCAPGPAGWRYFSNVSTNEPTPHDEIVDVVADAEWRPVRLRVDTGAHQLFLEADRDRLFGELDGVRTETPWHPNMHLDYLTPATNLITTKRLSDSAEIEVMFVEPYTLIPVVERQRYELLGDREIETPVGVFSATGWRFTALSSGWSSELWIAGDVVVRYDRLFTLETYDPGATGPRVVG